MALCVCMCVTSWSLGTIGSSCPELSLQPLLTPSRHHRLHWCGLEVGTQLCARTYKSRQTITTLSSSYSMRKWYSHNNRSPPPLGRTSLHVLHTLYVTIPQPTPTYSFPFRSIFSLKLSDLAPCEHHHRFKVPAMGEISSLAYSFSLAIY